MPRVKLGSDLSPKDPPIDWLWAAILERMKVKKVSLEALSVAAGISYGSMRMYAMHSPWEWPRAVRESACKRLGISFSLMPESIRLELEQ